MRKGGRGQVVKAMRGMPKGRPLPPPEGLIEPTELKPLAAALVASGLCGPVAAAYDASLAFFKAWESGTLFQPKPIALA